MSLLLFGLFSICIRTVAAGNTAIDTKPVQTSLSQIAEPVPAESGWWLTMGCVALFGLIIWGLSYASRRNRDTHIQKFEREMQHRDQTEMQLQKYKDDLQNLMEQRTTELRKLSRAVEQTHSTIMITDRQGVIEFVNPAFTRMTGYKKAEALGKNIDMLHCQDANLQQIEDMRNTLLKGEVWQGELRNQRMDGQPYWEYAIISPVKTDNGAITHFVAVIDDITERKKTEAELEKSRKQLRLAATVFAHSKEGIVISDRNHHIIDVNPACQHITGYTRKELLGKNPQLFSKGLHPDAFIQDIRAALDNEGHWDGELLNRKKTGEVFPIRLSLDAVYDEQGDIQHYVGVFYDITPMKEQQTRLQQIAYKDALTGLPNRLLLHDRMQQAIASAQRHETLVAICYLDLDGFKPVNDTYGHKAGDQILILIAERLQEILRPNDTVARLGGDEFVILLQDIHSVDELEQILGRVLKIIALPYELESNTLYISASIGATVYPLDQGEADTLLRHADQAMYAAKRKGKNTYCFFDLDDEQRLSYALLMQKEVEYALPDSQFRLLYQPKVNMRTGTLVGVEALIRWQHPEKGELLPGEFLQFIENSTSMFELGNWVLRQSMKQMHIWRQQGVEISISVNIAARQLQHPHFIPALKAILQEYADVPPHNLELEILESTALHDIGHVAQIMNECIELGVHFALDDFGTGYSSLTYLKNLPAVILKIDRSFIHNLLSDTEDQAIIKGILGLAHAFRRTPVAEGVESVEQGVALMHLGCEVAQGYYIARPMPADRIPEWIRSFKVPKSWRNMAAPNC